MNLFFIVSVPRSASTAIAKICNAATNCNCAIEPDAQSKVISRDMMDGKRVNINGWLKQVHRRVRRGLRGYEIYGEKDVTYGPMIPFLYQEFQCKFVYLVRNRADVVKSLLRWNDEMFGDIYQECREIRKLSNRAIANKCSGIKPNLSDYGRPRPGPPIPEWWFDLSLEEMCYHYRDRLTEIYDAALVMVPESHYIIVDVSSPALLSQVGKMRDFLGLGGLPLGNINVLLNERINSVEWRERNA